PWLEKSASSSCGPVAATQTTLGSASAHGYHGVASTSSPSLPAATTNSEPGAAAIASSSAWQGAGEAMLALITRAPARAAYASPSARSAQVPTLRLFNTRTGISETFQFTPATPMPLPP